MTECSNYECVENKVELARHHKDFERISRLVDSALERGSKCNSTAEMSIAFSMTLREIRGIVG